MQGYSVNIGELPAGYPTTKHEPAFWEALGRAVGTYGFLEEVLGKAIFALSGTRLYATEEEARDAFEKWQPKLERALHDTLGGLITSFEAEVNAQRASDWDHVEQLIASLRQASTTRNVICHGSWDSPDDQGASRPFFVRRDMMEFLSRVTIADLHQIQRSVAEVAMGVVNVVTRRGWQFPGMGGPGERIGPP